MNLLIIVFDSILNTVFFSQVLSPAIDLAKESSSVRIISFEKNIEKAFPKISSFGALPNNLEIRLVSRGSYLGNWTLALLARKVSFFAFERRVDKIICRGVFASKVLELMLGRTDHQGKLEVQLLVPGIASEEVALEHGIKPWVFSYFIKKLEADVFSNHFLSQFKNVEKKYIASSEGLKDYLISNYNLKPDSVDVLPEEEFVVDQSKKAIARAEVFLELGFEEEVILYCYSGGMQRWQSFELTLKKFLEIKSIKPRAKLLVLTLDYAVAQDKICTAGLSPNEYRLISRQAQEVERYLLASDFGMIMREANIVNWTSRPIKAIEYLKAGLEIIHNGTIQWIVRREK